MFLKRFVETDVHPFLLAIQQGIAQCHHYIGRSSHVNLKWAWNESEPELFALVAFNTNGKIYILRILNQWKGQQKPNSQDSLLA